MHNIIIILIEDQLYNLNRYTLYVRNMPCSVTLIVITLGDELLLMHICFIFRSYLTEVFTIPFRITILC